MHHQRPLTRRTMLKLSLGLGTSLALGAACVPEAAPAPSKQITAKQGAAPQPQPKKPEPEAARKIVGDVLDFQLEPDGWSGPFGSVTFRMHPGHFDGEEVWFIRTDASDQSFARDQELVFVPLMANALQAPESLALLYLVSNGASGQGAVVSTIPGRDDYTPAFRIHRVAFNGQPELLTSVAAVQAAESDGSVSVEQTDVVVNYPLVQWPGGGLPVDDELAEPLGKGPLVETPDTDTGTVTFKLHECFPGSRYIVTDTSAVPMAPMMGVVGSAPTQKLVEVDAVAPITIFVNGLDGPGVAGFQPAIFNESAGHPAWSPFWNHFAAKWTDPDQAVVVTSQAQLDDLVAKGDLERFNGTPDTHPNGFVVNCPSPVLAPNTYSA